MPSPSETTFKDDPAGYVLGYLDHLAWMDAELRAFTKAGDLAGFSSRRHAFAETMRAFDDIWRAYIVRRATEIADEMGVTMVPFPTRKTEDKPW